MRSLIESLIIALIVIDVVRCVREAKELTRHGRRLATACVIGLTVMSASIHGGTLIHDHLAAHQEEAITA